VDLGGRKNEPIFERLVCQTLHFTELEELLCFLHFGFAFRDAGRLERLEGGQVLLDVAVDALLIEGQELELFRLLLEDLRGCQGGVDFGMFGFDVVRVRGVAEGVEVVFDGAEPLTRNSFLASTSRG
jgi:hypothetical protein